MENKENNTKPVKRYAFIDVQNTDGTTNKILGFVMDWQKLFHYLKNEWQCEKIFFYSGIQQGDENTAAEYQALSVLGYEMRAKPYFIYKNRDGVMRLVCPKCKTEITQTVERGVKWKSNCDVELSVDAKNCVKKGDELLIFTGDGDFEYLIRDLITVAAKVYIVSNARKIQVAPRYSLSRFSTKLRKLIADEPERVFFLDINDWKMRIKKDV